MKLSKRWLTEYAQLSVEESTLVEQLTLAGHEVEAIEPVSFPFNQVVIGEIKATSPHPNAQRLTLCEVDINTETPLMIVCGAQNVEVGIKVPVAQLGAQLNEQLTIKKVVLRGESSAGMLCSREELGLGQSTDKGIWHLPTDAPLGEDLFEYLACDDVSLNLNITPNRGDCLSVLGIARELRVLNNQAPLSLEPILVSPIHQTKQTIQVKASSHCPRYLGRVIQKINSQAQTPIWMAERLRRSGFALIHPVVDITHYVLLLLGQPMHAFDHAKLQGEIEVRLSQPNETLTLLNGQTIHCEEGTLLIADSQQPCALAGIMGGIESSVTATTQTIFLESAFFDPILIAGKARHYGLHTEAAHRYERGVDPDKVHYAMEYATQLIVDILGGEPGPISEFSESIDEIPPVYLRKTQIDSLLGISITEEEVVRILSQLGMKVTAHPNQWEIKVPTHRFDIKEEVDLIEELARIYGYDKIPAKAFAMPAQRTMNNLTEKIKALLVGRDYQEVITFSFIEKQLQQLLDPHCDPKVLANPLSPEMEVMRTNLWPGLLTTLQHNLRRQQNRLRIFEVGLRFRPTSEGELIQEKVMAGLIYGDTVTEQWGIRKRAADFYDIKGDIEALLTLRQQGYEWRPSHHEALHPGRSADIYLEEKLMGHVGELHPRVTQELAIRGAVIVFELFLDCFPPPSLAKFTPFSKYPAIRRDIAIVLPKTITFNQVKHTIEATAGSLLQTLHLFDVYEGEGIAKDQQSLALSLIFQDFNNTLEDLTVNTLMDKIIEQIHQQCEGKLRK